MTPIEWLLSDDTGISSKTILAVMTLSRPQGTRWWPDVPHDPSDFGRCYRLLQKFPQWRRRLHEVADAYPMWGPMVAAWDELTALYEEESKRADRKCTKLYDRMKVLIDEGRIAAGWKQKYPGCWEGPGVNVVTIGRK